MWKLEERFWSKVDRRGPNDCWHWNGGRTNRGYGNFRMDGRTVKAHRVAFEFSTGVAPGTMFVCHRCDNPPCCNPSHLFLGTSADNNADMMAKGRHVRPARDEDAVNYVRGESSNLARITEADVVSIRARKAAGERTVALAKEYGVDRTLVWQIVTRKVWKHVP